jgi:alpha-beta hydrolase superfamily lysophospholipase
LIPSTPVTATNVPAPLRWMRAILSSVTMLGLLAASYFVGPRNNFCPNTPTPRAAPPSATAALDDWLQTSEAAYDDIKPGNAKGVVWATSTKQRTAWSVVYLHGFSASRLETAPVTEHVARALGANVFYARLTGHGRSGEAMASASAQDWMADASEAVRIGQTLGERVLLISCSTGSTLATWLALSPEAGLVAAHVFISPNFGPKDKRSEIINSPWGQKMVLTLQGETRGWTPDSEQEANAWTAHYPTRALFPMMAMVKQVRESDLSRFQTPVLVIFSERDQTVDPLETVAAFKRIASPLKAIQAVTYSKSPGQHVLAGDITSPEAVAPMVNSILKWIQSVPGQTY